MPESETSERQSSPWTSFGICLALAAITFAVFGQTLHHGFVNFDDGAYVYENPMVAQGVTLKGMGWAFTYGEIGHWHPLTWLSHMADCQMYGLKPAGHHLGNVLLHTAAVLLLFLTLCQMTGALWRSAFVAAVFAIHPLRVESVAWIAERKDVLSGAFFMLTLCAYARYARRPSRAGSILVAVLYGLGLLCKNTLVTLPFVLLLLDWWPLRRVRLDRGKENATGLFAAYGGLIKEKIPLFLLSIASCAATVLVPEKVFASDRIALAGRIGNALCSYCIYLKQMVFPVGLGIPYFNPPGGMPVWQIGLSAILLAAITIFAWVYRRRCPYLLVGWLWYVGMLVPMIGLVQISYYVRADRYTYLPAIGLAMAGTWGVADWNASWKHRRPVLGVLMVAVISALMVRAWNQTTYWKNNETLWQHSVECTADNYIAHNNLGDILMQKGKLEEALGQFQTALRIKPDYVEARYNIGVDFGKMGKLDEAMTNYQKALEIEPDYAEAQNNLGNALGEKGRLDEAIVHYEKALKIKPDYAEAHNNLGDALRRQGKVNDAISHFEQAFQIKPDFAGAHYNDGIALSQDGKLNEAVAQYQEALAIEPKFAEAHFKLGTAFLQAGLVEQAVAEYQTALQIKADYFEAHLNLGNIFAQQGKYNEAINHFQQALKASPKNPLVENGLAWLLATCPKSALRDGQKALALAQEANTETGGTNPLILHTLAAACAQVGRFADAQENAQKAIDLARKSGRKDMEDRFTRELKRYQTGLPPGNQ